MKRWFGRRTRSSQRGTTGAHNATSKRIVTSQFGRRSRQIPVLAAVALAAVGLGSVLLAGGAGAAPAKPTGAATGAGTGAAPALIRKTTALSRGDAVAAYWTKARMASAKPVGGIAVPSGAQSGAQALNAGNSATGTPGLAGGYQPVAVPNVSGSAASSPNAGRTSTSVLPADGGYPGPNNTFDWIGSYTPYPVSTVGKLFFTEPTGNYVCSAAATYGGGTLDMVWTAGHCVGAQGGRAYYNNWLFCPSYKSGENPSIGCWSWALAQQTGGWYFNGYWSADYAYLYMQPTGDKRANHVVKVTGGLGFAWNWSRDQSWMDFGYPQASPYNGNSLVVTAAEHRYDVSNPGGDPGQADDSIGSSQTPGFSGGPWILSFGRPNGDPIGHGNWINGNNSYYFTSGGPGGGNEYGTEIQSPYYDTNACNFWKGGSGWTGTC
jgi:hypothetical protein